MPNQFSISLDHALIGDEKGVVVKIQSDDCELNVVLRADEIPKLKRVAEAKWSERSSVKLGACLSSPSFWSCEGGKLTVLVGKDAEAWEVGMTLPETILADLEREIVLFQMHA